LIFLGWDIEGDMKDCSATMCTVPADNNYIGPDGGDWHTAANWSRGAIPNECDRVSIGLDNSVNLSADALCYTLDVFPGSSLTIDGHELVVSAMLSN